MTLFQWQLFFWLYALPALVMGLCAAYSLRLQRGGKRNRNHVFWKAYAFRGSIHEYPTIGMAVSRYFLALLPLVNLVFSIIQTGEMLYWLPSVIRRALYEGSRLQDFFSRPF